MFCPVLEFREEKWTIIKVERRKVDLVPHTKELADKK
jgi:hypothetical protein